MVMMDGDDDDDDDDDGDDDDDDDGDGDGDWEHFYSQICFLICRALLYYTGTTSNDVV